MIVAKKVEEQNESLTEYILRSAETKKKSPAEWWETTVQNIEKCQVASHVGKFTHPDSQIGVLVEPGEPDVGYVTTQGCQYREDIMTPAQYMGSASLLLKNQSDGRDILKWMESTPESIEQELSEAQLTSPSLRQAIKTLRAKSYTLPTETDERLKQVYFPVGEEHQYHLLTVLPASGLLLEMKQRLRQMGEHRRLCYSDKEEQYGEDCEDMPNLTEVGFGGTKAQNISAMNSRFGGTAYLLPSLPPVWMSRKVRLPKRDFFRDGLLFRMAKESVQALHRLFLLDWNNQKIREGVQSHVDTLADMVAGMAERMREEPAGWSREEAFDGLPESQKIWLDEARREERLDSEEWLDAVGTDFGRWLIRTYERVAGHEKVGLGDPELRFFKYRLIEVLREEVRMEK